jgi:hypothetical protein
VNPWKLIARSLGEDDFRNIKFRRSQQSRSGEADHEEESLAQERDESDAKLPV